MKRSLLILASSVSFFVACNSNPSTNSDMSTSPKDSTLSKGSEGDTAHTIMMNGVSDTLVGKDGSQYVKVAPVTAKPISAEHKSKSVTTQSAASQPAASSTTAPASASTPVKKKKGWSNAAKGTVIGAGAGAVTGAIVSKKKGTGAIIGGLIGAGGGYVVGNEIDKKKAQKKQ